MHRRAFLFLVSASAVAACGQTVEKQAPSTPEPAAPDPAEAIRPLYQRYMTPPAATTFPTLEEQAPWSDDLKEQLVAMMARSDARNEPILDFDPFTGAQDWELTNLNVSNDAVVPGSHAVVRAHFTNMGSEDEVVFDLIWQHDQWRIDNMRGANWDLRQVISG